MAVFIFIVVMVVIGAAFAIPVVWAAGDRRKDANMVAMGGALLGGGVNGVGLGLAVFVLATEDVDTVPLLRLADLSVAGACRSGGGARHLQGQDAPRP